MGLTKMETRRTTLIALTIAAAAHVGVLVFAARAKPIPPPAPTTHIENVLLGHVDMDRGGDFVAEGIVRARLRNR